MTPTTIQDQVNYLIASGLTPEMISARLDGRVSARTIYRWKQGEHAPQQRSDAEALTRLVIEMQGAAAASAAGS